MTGNPAVPIPPKRSAHRYARERKPLDQKAMNKFDAIVEMLNESRLKPKERIGQIGPAPHIASKALRVQLPVGFTLGLSE